MLFSTQHFSLNNLSFFFPLFPSLSLFLFLLGTISKTAWCKRRTCCNNIISLNKLSYYLTRARLPISPQGKHLHQTPYCPPPGIKLKDDDNEMESPSWLWSTDHCSLYTQARGVKKQDVISLSEWNWCFLWTRQEVWKKKIKRKRRWIREMFHKAQVRKGIWRKNALKAESQPGTKASDARVWIHPFHQRALLHSFCKSRSCF